MTKRRLHIRIRGAVQGVGFRPFLHKLLVSEQLAGRIRNLSDGVEVEAEGDTSHLESLLLRLEKEKPPLARITGLEPKWLTSHGIKGVEFLPSSDSPSETRGIVLPDIATCPDCLREILDPKERRYNYPFTNCTNCGPRYTIVESLPYDRERTAMKQFAMCRDCLEEYENPGDRRFHAQPIACPSCGPSLEACLTDGTQLAHGRDANTVSLILDLATRRLESGGIITLMGMGGMQLLVDATQEAAVSELRRRKARDAKPFAVMVADITEACRLASISPLEQRLLSSPEAPIVLLSPASQSPDALAPSVLEGSPWIGIMLPTTPLHHLLLRHIGKPLVATSGNLSHEPMCTTKPEALAKLGTIADLFILHDRPILRPVDDSVARIVNGRELILRRARGYAPLPVGAIHHGKGNNPSPSILATGAQLKNAIGWHTGHAGSQTILAQHIGDLDDLTAMKAWEQTRRDAEQLLASPPDIIAVDAHPDYLPSQRGYQEAKGKGIPCIPIQHHVAHILACIEENEAPLPLIGIAWDGTGFGENGTIWGGEWLLMKQNDWERLGHLRPFLLPGGDAAVREPRRVALSLLDNLPPDACPILRQRVKNAFSDAEYSNLRLIIKKRLNCPETTSMGRLFDAAAFLLGFDGSIRCEGQASIWLEAMALGHQKTVTPPPLFHIERANQAPFIIDWEPWLHHLDSQLAAGTQPEQCAREFHLALAEIAVTAAKFSGTLGIAASGGCFQNTLLLQMIETEVARQDIPLYLPQRIPPNDGGIALGQIAAVLRHYPPFSPLPPSHDHVPSRPR